MPSAYFKINVNFSMKDDNSDEDNDPVLTQYIPEVSDGIEISFITTDGRNISYTPHKSVIDSGSLTILIKGIELVVSCNAVFKLSVKQELFDAVLNGQGKWYSSGLKGVYGLIEGLTEEKYHYKNRFSEGEAIRYLIPVEVSPKKIK
jgi:hypothetical protein